MTQTVLDAIQKEFLATKAAIAKKKAELAKLEKDAAALRKQLEVDEYKRDELDRAIVKMCNP